MNSFCDFVMNGRIGQVRLGLSRKETIRLLGHPKDWLAKSTVISKPCPTYDQSNLWFYYEGSVGVRFGDEPVADAIALYPGNFRKHVELFQGWPITHKVTMREWRAALVENRLTFRESDSESLNYWIIAAQTCVAFGFPFASGGRPLRWYERSVDILIKFRDPQAMMRECGFIETGVIERAQWCPK